MPIAKMRHFLMTIKTLGLQDEAILADLTVAVDFGYHSSC